MKYPVLSKENVDIDKVNVIEGKFLYGSDIVSNDFYSEFSPPSSFLGRCSDDELSSNIVKYCVKNTVNNRLSVLLADGKPVRAVKSRRAILQLDEVEEIYNETAMEMGGFYESPISEMIGLDGLKLSLKTSKEFTWQITPKVGDCLSAGSELTYFPARTISSVGLIERLICLNGARVNSGVFSWQADSESAHEQRNYIKLQAQAGISHISQFIVRAKQMAEMKVSDPHKALAEYARILHVPGEFVPALIENYEQEPEATEWGLYNALTRAATHDSRFSEFSEKLKLSSGEWAKSFDRVSARVPRPIAAIFGGE